MMASRSPSRLAVSRHVHLRTQQRRLRHVRTIIVRNLTIAESELFLGSPLALAVHFTLHPTHDTEIVLYKSEPVLESYNPSWEAIHFTADNYTKYATLPAFTLRVWASHYHGRGRVSAKNSRIALERMVDLSDLAYLGTMVNKDGSGYPSNSLVVGMFDGYYTHASVPGVMTPPKVMHSMMDLLPPMSLLEVNKSEVQDSYHHPTLKRILNRQEVLNSATSASKQRREAVKAYKVKEQTYFQHRQERERLSMRVKLLQQQLKEEQSTEDTERKALNELKEQLDTREESLGLRLKELEELREQYYTDYQHHCKRMERLSRFERFCTLRERTMIHELGQTFFISEAKDAYAICNIILPNADQHDQPGYQDQLGVALGYVAQLVHHVAATLSAPLQYPLHLNGSKSAIYDYISDISAIQNNRDFPLFLRGSEKEVYMYAVYLLNKDICQLRQYSGLGISKSLFKHTLPNLKALIDKLTRPMMVESKPEVSLSLQAISVPTPSITSTSRSNTGDSREQANNNNMAAASPPSETLTTNASYPRLPSPPIPSPPMSLYQENEALQQQQQRGSISPEPSNTDPSSNQMQSPPLQFELHEAFPHPPVPNHAHPPASSAYAIAMKPVSMLPLLSPIISEGSPGPTEDREWMMSPSHSHADLHKAGNQRLERELSPIGLGLHVAGEGEEEEEGGAAGGGGIMFGAIELDKLSSDANGITEAHQDRGNAEKKGLTLIPETLVGVMTSSASGEGGERELVEMAEVGVEKSTDVERTENERTFQPDSDQGLPPHLDNQHKDSSVLNSFQGDLAPPTAVVEYPPSPGNGTGGGFMKTGLATPHMIRSTAWEPTADDKQTQVTYRTSIQEGSQSPQTDTHFLEDFID